MRRALRFAIPLSLILIFTAALYAQAPQHAVTLTWIDAANPAGTTYSVYRATGLCSGTPTFSKVQSGVAAKTYEDATVTTGNYCYKVTATFNNVESGPSPTALAAVPSFSPSSLSVVVK